MRTEQIEYIFEIFAFFIAFLVSLLRSIKKGVKLPFISFVIEPLLCATLSVGASELVYAYGLSSHYAVFFGALIGYLGSSTAYKIIIFLFKR